MKPPCRYYCLTILLLITLGLFFGLFFRLNYPEIVRHGWPLTRCKVLSSEIATRYCCYSSCQDITCQSAPSNSPSCGTVISSIQNNFSPDACSANSSSCPMQVGSACGGGYKCCNTCCQQHLLPATPAASSAKLAPNTVRQEAPAQNTAPRTTAIVTAVHRPTISPAPSNAPFHDGVHHNASDTQDFSTNENKADDFLDSHAVNSTALCYFNPKNESQARVVL
ncbi:hypothetical protein FB45DRAFT_1053244 [Roridomyces roridus]|uniref:Uncharacterized protein n=1 Tax=Roridomyces roridus TaxID=1738132 RepID=A0AAD7CBN6_9AGAR|nr:hypothetical protein FB45DRAFT_1053244 [Roridomyces roridus]